MPAYGIGPISSSQDTADPMDRTVANAAMHLQSMVGRDPKNEAGYAAVLGPNWQASIKQAPVEAPDYMSALDLDLVRGQRISYNGSFDPGTPSALAFDALVAAGAIMVERPSIPVGDVPALPSGYQQHKAIDEYYLGLGASAPINSLEEEVAVNAAESDQALKSGNQNHAVRAERDGVPRGYADLPGGVVGRDRQHDEQPDAGRSFGRLPRDPGQRAARGDRRDAADHHPNGVLDDASAGC